MRRGTKRLTISAALVALTVVLLWLGSLIEVLDLVTAFVASLFIAFSVAEFGVAWSFLPWIAAGTLSCLLMPGAFISWEYALLVGVLPILKALWERIRIRPIAFLGKFVSFNLLFSAILVIFHFFFGGLFTDLTLFGRTIPALAVPILLAVLGNLAFLLYDYLLTRMIFLYYTKWRARIERLLR